MSDAFDVIPFEDIKGDWKKLGSGSFGNVYKGTYLGIDVAIKEVLPSTEYDVSKYFEREWRLMKEARHPNVVLYLGLSRAPPPDSRIFIISEFIDNGNLRMYIHDKSKPFPWRVRMSFATDIARALAYLHARKCIHRDLKGENLLVTSNGRLKITDFGFARIAARNEDELKRLTFCGTDSYMSPEILLGEEFDLPTDIYSLGIIYCEIASRTLADDSHFKRTPPTFNIDADEIRSLASPGCPEAFIKLCLDCLETDTKARPTTRDILERLRTIEAEVLSRPNESDGGDVHVGSIKFMTGGKRPAGAPRIPSFGMDIGKDISGAGDANGASMSDDSDDELMEAIEGLSSIELHSEWGNAATGHEPLLRGSTQSVPESVSEYSTTVIRGHPSHHAERTTTHPPSLSSILTIRPSPSLDPHSSPNPILPSVSSSSGASSISGTSFDVDNNQNSSSNAQEPTHILGNTKSLISIASIDSYHTAASSHSSIISSALATEGGSTVRSLYPDTINPTIDTPLVHRFTLLKPGAKPKRNSGGFSQKSMAAGGDAPSVEAVNGKDNTAGWNPLELIFSSGLLVAKCDVCMKRLGWKPVFECDDCGLRAHVRCGEVAPRDCGLRPLRPGFKVPGGLQQSTSTPMYAMLGPISPLSKVKQNAAIVATGMQAAAGKTKSVNPSR